jgi:hypothetical protein
MALLDLQGMETGTSGLGEWDEGGSNCPSDLSVLICHTSTISVTLC